MLWSQLYAMLWSQLYAQGVPHWVPPRVIAVLGGAAAGRLEPTAFLESSLLLLSILNVSLTEECKALLYSVLLNS